MSLASKRHNKFLTLLLVLAVNFMPVNKALALPPVIAIALSVAIVTAATVVTTANVITCDVNILWGCGGNGGGGTGSAPGTGGSGITGNTVSEPTEYCYTSTPQPTLTWNSAVQQSAYQINVATDSGFSNIVTDTGKVISTSQSYQIATGILSYNTTYYWRIKIWDNNDTSGTYSSSNFTTAPHQGPSVNFAWSPSKPVRGATITFTDATGFFGGASAGSYNWTFPPNAVPLTPPTTDAIEKVKFTTLSTKSNVIKLSVTDSDNLTCSASKNATLTGSIIDFKEVR